MGFREVRDGQGQVRVQISARRMEGELARPEGDSALVRGQDQDLAKTWSLARVRKPGSL